MESGGERRRETGSGGRGVAREERERGERSTRKDDDDDKFGTFFRFLASFFLNRESSKHASHNSNCPAHRGLRSHSSSPSHRSIPSRSFVFARKQRTFIPPRRKGGASASLYPPIRFLLVLARPTLSRKMTAAPPAQLYGESPPRPSTSWSPRAPTSSAWTPGTRPSKSS